MSSLTDRVEALEASATRLAGLVRPLTPQQLTALSYASEWTIAEVLSHLGSGAVIMRGNIDAVVSGNEVEAGFNQSVWDEWNAKTPAAKASDALLADRALLDRVAGLSDAERASFQFSAGPMVLDLPTFLGLRLNEHVVHSWDIDVAIHPDATLSTDAVGIVIDNLGMIVGFAGKSDGNERIVAVRTTQPDRVFALTIRPDAVSLAPLTDSTSAAVELPSEAFVRLVYGRLDMAHTPSGVESSALDELRKLFPGL
jgi:uncharacterized protein (TIGR03083 family)